MRTTSVVAITVMLASSVVGCGIAAGGNGDAGVGVDTSTGRDGALADGSVNDGFVGIDAASDQGVSNLDVNDAAPTTADVAADSDAGRPLFGPCNLDSGCGPRGNYCFYEWPGGICSKQCVIDQDCGENGLCFQQICLPRCTPTQHADDGTITVPGGGECRGHGELCFALDRLDPTRGACLPSCNIPMDPGVPECPYGGLPCDLYFGSCSDDGVGDFGVDNGAPSENDATMTNDCHGGYCYDATNMGQPTGFVGGYCYSVAIQLDASAYAPGMPIPRSNCPMGSVMLPADPTRILPGDPARCWKDCAANSDCRAGYECFEFPQTNGGNEFTSGACLPINCRSAAWIGQVNQGCPTGTTCIDRTGDAGSPVGVCG